MSKSNLIFISLGLVFIGAVVYQSIQREKTKDGDSKCGCAGGPDRGRGGTQTLEYDNGSE